MKSAPRFGFFSQLSVSLSQNNKRTTLLIKTKTENLNLIKIKENEYHFWEVFIWEGELFFVFISVLFCCVVAFKNQCYST